MLNRLTTLLESFYVHEGARGVAFVSPVSNVTFGRPVDSIMWMVERVEGFLQSHSEKEWVSIYASKVRRETFLIVQFPFQEEYPPPLRPWLAFVRLSFAVYRGESGDPWFPPGAGAPILQPGPRLPYGGDSTLEIAEELPRTQSAFIVDPSARRWPRSNSP
jgi:hypothetical protein